MPSQSPFLILAPPPRSKGQANR
ncbi:MAG: hypothetical protein E2O74_06520 [Chloroflexi bacterium]|nr:MAG: hypothetical protein E2O74_06520 [Chloroflexota bacterium]